MNAFIYLLDAPIENQIELLIKILKMYVLTNEATQ